MPEIGRNDPCPCGSGKKYKKCCEAKDEAKERTVIEKQWTESEKKFEKEKAEQTDAEKAAAGKPGAVAQKKTETAKPVVQKHQTFQAPKYNMPRKSGGGA